MKYLVIIMPKRERLYQTAAYRIISNQIPIAKEICEDIKAGYKFHELVYKYLPEYVDDNGVCSLKLRERKVLKRDYIWSSNFDGTIRIPMHFRDELFTILFELDAKQSPLGRRNKNKPQPRKTLLTSCTEPYLIEVKINALSCAIKSINESELEPQIKCLLINDIKNALSI